MAPVIYALCSLTALLCAVLLLRSYARTRFRLLMWSGLSFVGFTVTNVLLMLDRATGPELDLSTLRLGAGLVSVLLIVVGLIQEA